MIANLPAGGPVPLSRLRRGQTGVICESRVSREDAALLRAMGLCVSARVRLCRAGEPCIVALGCGCAHAGGGVSGEGGNGLGGMCRIGLARPLAERIFVTTDP